MKKAVTLAAGLVLSGLMIATGYAGPNDGAGARQTEGLQSVQSGTSAPQKSGLSKRNKAVIEQSKAAQMRQDNIRSSGSGTTPKKNLSKRNKAKLSQEDASKKMHEQMRAGPSSTIPK
jgi:hypothetical protein